MSLDLIEVNGNLEVNNLEAAFDAVTKFYSFKVRAYKKAESDAGKATYYEDKRTLRALENWKD